MHFLERKKISDNARWQWFKWSNLQFFVKGLLVWSAFYGVQTTLH